jgi:hypothetical protein
MGFFDQWGDVLRVVGRFLDARGAEEIEIKNEQQLVVRWKTDARSDESISYTEFDIARLREQAPLMRRPVAPPPKGGREELLRTLGQEMDESGITVDDVLEVSGSFRVHGHDATGPVYRFYSRAELKALSDNRRAMRNPSTEAQDVGGEAAVFSD